MDKRSLFKGLRTLSASAFPKTCRSCGRVFQSIEAFIAETVDIPLAKTPLKAAREADGSILLEVFRNCPCGSTLMDEFHDRRDLSESGRQRRALFQKLLDTLHEEYDIPLPVARRELLKVLHGEHSNLIANLFPDDWQNRLQKETGPR